MGITSRQKTPKKPFQTSFLPINGVSEPERSASNSDTDSMQEGPSHAEANGGSVGLLERERPIKGMDAMALEEVIRGRSDRVKKLLSIYREQYWLLMEELRYKYREYSWRFGKCGFDEKKDERERKEEREREGEAGVGSKLEREGGVRCLYQSCKAKPMALCDYCHAHVLSDSKQQLYKGCSYVIKSLPSGAVICGKPVLKATVPSLCSNHVLKTRRNVALSLKKAGLGMPSSNKHASKFHVMIAEYVRFIQAKRRRLRNGFSSGVSEIKPDT
ncbi:hypothetical protein AMTRI_Chr03g139790 [Amborella trichopoda]|uniref:KAT8 regulatory NSL complex subunit 2 n=1 Tax=Amborella trichopoda TaxID=13333 RepID=W1NTN0_AMBTC|nr:INO80 complex subunit D [Amborella trichopoda]XP_020519696.1 INO80 complex subunit D [Amborella trichopoda]XP_020519697.1 INO80 complex subunit D [Amborella trichopoda]ERN00912.1 hypothetical protein AMTR_s00103p00156950 [Amborella trichopoda]|eukprot:XP_020519694.1 INO80 complex subunit D [Amborella trichopoda]